MFISDSTHMAVGTVSYVVLERPILFFKATVRRSTGGSRAGDLLPQQG